MIFIRCDGNKEIALGHVQRCLSIADAMEKEGCSPIFITATKESTPIIEGRGYNCILLNTDYRKMEEELSELKKIADDHSSRGGSKHLFLVDSYQVTKAYFEGLGKIGKTAYIDDMGKEAYRVDVLINYDIHGEEIPYDAIYQSEGISLPKHMLLGCKYAPLRREFTVSKKDSLSPKNPLSILITTGGGDKEGILKALPEYLEGIDACFNIVIGPFVEEDERQLLGNLAGRDARFTLHENVKNMSELMKASDIGISAAGSTIYELCAMGVPSVIFTFAKNQREMARGFNKKAGVPYCGDAVTDGKKVFESIRTELMQLMDNKEKARELGTTMKSIVDGLGAGRIAIHLMKL